jgi:hypothetical protein
LPAASARPEFERDRYAGSRRDCDVPGDAVKSGRADRPGDSGPGFSFAALRLESSAMALYAAFDRVFDTVVAKKG